MPPSPSPSCLICHSTDVGEYVYDGSPVLWCYCHHCTHMWMGKISSTPAPGSAEPSTPTDLLSMRFPVRVIH
jgi:hypothetical protein